MRNSYASYPVELSVQYHTSEDDPSSGEGRTLTMSREAVRFVCDQPFTLNQEIQLVIAWPAKLPGGASLNLLILGIVTRCAAGCVEVRIRAYSLKTRCDTRLANVAHPKTQTGLRHMIAGS